jgi:ATP-binding cassette, subfamily B, bacterial
VITIDGTDVSTVKQRSLRESIAYVPQEPALFHRTLTENIRYARPGATDAQVRRAARLAHCDEFISRLPQGYDTYVGERGVKLSGGERQRVAIARAILKDAPIVLFDEATSSLDSESEQLIQAALDDLMRNKTTIVIAHRLSTIAHMDRIIVVEEGAVRAMGGHKILYDSDSRYRTLWDIQAGGFAKE